MAERAGTASAGPCEMVGSTPPLPTTSRSTPHGEAPGVMTRGESRAGSTPAERTKLYAVVRSDLCPGAKACQAAHALRAFQAAYPELEAAWWAASNRLVLLEAPAHELARLEARAGAEGASCVRFVEPDWEPAGTLTALALGPDAARLVASLRLALRP